MRFNAKFLQKAGGPVFVLMENDESNPVAVVTDESHANLFVGQNKKHNWYRFNLDELPENIQPVPPTPPVNEQIQKAEETRKRVEETTQQMQQFLKNVRQNRR